VRLNVLLRALAECQNWFRCHIIDGEHAGAILNSFAFLKLLNPRQQFGDRSLHRGVGRRYAHAPSRFRCGVIIGNGLRIARIGKITPVLLQHAIEPMRNLPGTNPTRIINDPNLSRLLHDAATIERRIFVRHAATEAPEATSLSEIISHRLPPLYCTLTGQQKQVKPYRCKFHRGKYVHFGFRCVIRTGSEACPTTPRERSQA